MKRHIACGSCSRHHGGFDARPTRKSEAFFARRPAKSWARSLSRPSPHRPLRRRVQQQKPRLPLRRPQHAAPAPARRGDREAAPAAPKKAGSPLDISALPFRQAANQVLRERINARANGDWDQLPYIPAAATAAAYGLSDSARVTLVETRGLGPEEPL